MIKKYLIFFFAISSFLLGNQLKNVNSFEAKVIETTVRNNKDTVTKYNLKVEFPDKVFKTITYPKMNKGEIYLYLGKEKKIYYPILEQMITQKIDENENQILRVLKDLKESKRADKLEILEYESGTKIFLKNYKKIDNINFPTNVKIYEDDILISKLEFSDIKINPKLNEKDFQINTKD